MKKLIIVSFCLFLAACLSSKNSKNKVEDKPVPEWVNARPSSGSYYIGIGYASKKTFPVDFREVARKNALSNMASEISVTISTESVLSQLETDNRFKEQFQQDIRVTANEQIEGYDEVESYESKDGYWTYYHLSKADYLEAKQKKLKDAMSQGTDFLLKAKEYKNQMKYKEALQAYILGIDKIKGYLDQSLETQLNGEKIFLGNELFNGYRSLLNNIVIDGEVEVYRVKMGTPGSVKFSVKNLEGKALSGIPLTVEVKKQLYTYSDLVSDSAGKITVNVGKVNRQTQEQFILVQVNVKQLIKESGAGSMVTKILSMINSQPEKINIEVQPVFVIIKSVEKNNGSPLSVKMLDAALREGLSSNGFIAVNVIEKADIIIEINAESKNASVAREMNTEFYSSVLNAEIVFKNKSTSTEIYQSNLNGIKGNQLSFEKAADDAYIKAAKKIKLSVVDEFLKVYSE